MSSVTTTAHRTARESTKTLHETEEVSADIDTINLFGKFMKKADEAAQSA